MVGRTTLIGCLAALLATGAAIVAARQAEASVQAIKITAETAETLQFNLVGSGGQGELVIVAKSGASRAAYPAGSWSSRVEVRPDGTIRTLSGTQLQVAQGAAGSPMVGGPCTYYDLAGTATIVRVVKTPASSQQSTVSGGPGYEGFEVSFSFTPQRPITDPAARDFAQQPNVVRLTNSWYPGPRYIEKYGLSQGRKVPALLKVRTSGACAPMLFAFPGIDLADYFEHTQ